MSLRTHAGSGTRPATRSRARARTSFFLCAALLGPTLAGCELPPATAVVVAVKSELIAGVQVGQLTYRVFEASDNPEKALPVAEFTTAIQNFEKPFIVTRAHADTFLLSVEGFVAGERDAVIVYRERVQFVPGKTLALRVFLSNACYQNPCPQFGGLTCFGEAYGNTLPGQCDAIPGPRELPIVERPGEERDWEPEATSASLIDAGFGASDPFEPWTPPPRVDAGLGGLGCIGSKPTMGSRSCWPSDASVLDASYPPPLFDLE